MATPASLFRPGHPPFAEMTTTYAGYDPPATAFADDVEPESRPAPPDQAAKWCHLAS